MLCSFERKKKQRSQKVMRRMIKILTKVSGLMNMRAPRRRRIFHRDVEEQQQEEEEDEEDEFQIAGRYCLSSYYSVFVARLAIMVMLAILIGLLTILTWHFTRIYTNQSLNSLAGGLRYELLQRPVLRMWNILNSTSEITSAHVKLSQYVIRKYSTKLNNQADQVELYEEMRAISWALFASRKALNAITINYRNGFVQAFHRDHRTNNTFYIYSDLVNYSIGATGSMENNLLTSRRAWNDEALQGNSSAIWYQEPLDPVTGDKIGKATPIQPDDLINIAGLSQVPDGVASWHVAVSKYTDSPLLSAALPVWDAANESIVAVVGVTTALYSVGQLMRELVEVHGGHIYLTSREGYLLATSTNAPLLTNTSKVPQLMMAADCADDVIRMGAQWLQKEYGNQLPPDQVIHDGKAKLGHEQYYVDSFFLKLKRLPIVGVILIPRKYIMGKVDERAFKTLMILISASLCILFVGCICIFILTNGVSKEMKLRAELISQLDARRRAEASSNYKSQFLANMSHELRTPMAAVIGLLDILICDDCLTNEQYSTVTQIRKCSTALLRLLNNILDLSKVESGKLVLEDAEFDLGRELEGLVDMFSVQRMNHNVVETVLDLSDDIPKMVRGDSGRVVQIFANLLSNSIKFTTTGHILLRGWSESLNMSNEIGKFSSNLRKPNFVFSPKGKQHGTQMKKLGKRDSKIILWFEVEDTGIGIDPSKWESVFESFEQADPSTTRTHGGTGLGLCIVRTLVNKMGGEIKVVKKNGPGTLMRLYLVLDTPSDAIGPHCRTDFSPHQLVVILALHRNMTRSVTSQWLHKTGILTLEASEWNQLTQILHHLFPSRGSNNGFEPHPSVIESLRVKLRSIEEMVTPVFIIVVDIGLLDLSTSIWKEQLNFLDRFSSEVKFAWLVSHDTSNSIKTELRRKGHDLMVNKPLYKTKMVQILESVVNERIPDTASHECLDLESTNFDRCSSNDSVASDNTAFNSYGKPKLLDIGETSSHGSSSSSPKAEECPRKTEKPGQKSLEGLRILLAEDTPVLQRVATIMLEKMGAMVVAVGDGLQAVEALNCMLDGEMADDCRGHETITKLDHTPPPYDLVLMDCQMPKMDGYEATMTIRRWEEGRGWHIPIVALTAHAMSSDEAKCLEVGMDAYLTKPIDYKLMVSTILSLTKPTA